MPKLSYSSDNVQTRPILDPGTYHVRINETKVIEGQAGKRDRLTLNMVVASGENAGFPVYAGFSLPTPEDANIECHWERDQGMGERTRTMEGFLLSMIKPAADACGVAWGKTGFDPDDFMGRECNVVVGHREYQGEMQMDITAWRRLEG